MRFFVASGDCFTAKLGDYPVAGIAFQPEGGGEDVEIVVGSLVLLTEWLHDQHEAAEALLAERMAAAKSVAESVGDDAEDRETPDAG